MSPRVILFTFFLFSVCVYVSEGITAAYSERVRKVGGHINRGLTMQVQLPAEEELVMEDHGINTHL